MQTEHVDLNMSLNNRKREEFRVYLIESIEEVLSFSQVVLNFLEIYTDFSQECILDEPRVFCAELEDLFGASAKGIEDIVIERLYSKIDQKYRRDRTKSFEDYLSEALKCFTEFY